LPEVLLGLFHLLCELLNMVRAVFAECNIDSGAQYALSDGSIPNGGNCPDGMTVVDTRDGCRAAAAALPDLGKYNDDESWVAAEGNWRPAGCFYDAELYFNPTEKTEIRSPVWQRSVCST